MKLIVLALLLAACGSKKGSGGDDNDEPTQDDGTETDAGVTGAESSQYAKLIEDVAALPACDADHEGALVYVKATSEFQNCAGGKWSVIEVGAKDRHYACGGSLDSPHDDKQFFYEIRQDAIGIFITAGLGSEQVTSFYTKEDDIPDSYRAEVGGATMERKHDDQDLYVTFVGAVSKFKLDECASIGEPFPARED